VSEEKTNHWFLFKLAIVFLTRWPVVIKQKVEDDALNAATGYFALVGLVVAAVSASVFLLSNTWLPSEVAIVLAMVASILFTGAFHEDGLADMADGLGGGWTAEAKLKIMKDSRIGTYGSCALILILLLKYQLLLALAEMSALMVVTSLVVGHSVSRALAASVIGSLEYVQLDQESKTKPVAQSLSIASRHILFLTVSTVLTIVWLYNLLSFGQILWLLAVALTIRFFLIKFIKRQLGGYTGDVLGAFQQLFEVGLYMTLLAMVGA